MGKKILAAFLTFFVAVVVVFLGWNITVWLHHECPDMPIGFAIVLAFAMLVGICAASTFSVALSLELYCWIESKL